MISRVEGELIRVEDGRAEVRVGGIVHEVLIPAADEARLLTQVGGAVQFHTLHYLEGQGQGSSFWPRLIGFRSPLERDFFELFTTVKGIGNRKALRALQMPFGMVAELIARRDVSMLTTLPEIGRKTAETIVVELKGKVERFTVLGRGGAPDGAIAEPSTQAAAKPKRKGGVAPAPRNDDVAPRYGVSAARKAAAAPGSAESAPRGGNWAESSTSILSDAVEILVQLGEARVAARQLVERALDREPGIRAADRLVAAALRER